MWPEQSDRMQSEETHYKFVTISDLMDDLHNAQSEPVDILIVNLSLFNIDKYIQLLPFLIGFVCKGRSPV